MNDVVDACRTGSEQQYELRPGWSWRGERKRPLRPGTNAGKNRYIAAFGRSRFNRDF